MQLRVLDVKLRGYHSDPIYLGPADLEELSCCPACTASDQQRHLALAAGSDAEGLRVTFCPQCGHAYLSRRPTQDWFQAYYATQWDTHGSRAAPSLSHRMRRRIQRVGLARRAVRAGRVLQRDVPGAMYPGPARLLQMISGLGPVEGDSFPAGRKLLEIGSGYGAALAFFRDAGLEVYGTEASAHRAAACRALGLDVQQTSITNLDPVAHHAPFDFVYSSHVFEHLTDLDRMMAGVARLVKEGGFVYIEVPHSLLAEDLVLRSHIPVHLHMFSAASLIAVLQRAGLQPVRVLADVNLHVVAHKGEIATPIGRTRIPTMPEDLVHGLESVAGEQGDVRVRFDQYQIDVSRADDNATLYSRPFPYGNLTSVDGDRNEFRLRFDGADESQWPIRFVHATPQPPIWVK